MLQWSRRLIARLAKKERLVFLSRALGCERCALIPSGAPWLHPKPDFGVHAFSGLRLQLTGLPLHNRPMRSARKTLQSHRELGREAGVSSDDHQAIRLWLRLLSCSTQIEQSIRALLRSQFGTTLPRFDYLAQLDRFPEGLRMTSLSSHLMVTGANVTGLTDQLVAEGWVERVDDPHDRRALIVRMTPAGKAWFDQMAVEHERWLVQLLGGIGARDMKQLHQLLGKLRESMPPSRR